jgi:hypothetical protein
MGLLDDAIREHLELKRRRGADPGEVAREQREALDSTEAAKAASDEVDTASTHAGDAGELADADGYAPADDGLDDEQGVERPAHDAVAGETAELDMSSVLGDGDAGDKASVTAAERPSEEQARADRAVDTTQPADEDSLEWEMPTEAAEGEASEVDEDVLEETPDFLRDTPEQDRLWFEQQPPRDFDFDK